jgi:hypothetical protein
MYACFFVGYKPPELRGAIFKIIERGIWENLNFAIACFRKIRESGQAGVGDPA